jgi:hypothetical protein
MVSGTSANTGGGNDTFSQRAARKLVRVSGPRRIFLRDEKTEGIFITINADERRGADFIHIKR